MDVIAWSQNLTEDVAAEAGARYVGKGDLFSLSDVLTIHLKLTERSRNVVRGGGVSADETNHLAGQHFSCSDCRRARISRRPSVALDRGSGT